MLLERIHHVAYRCHDAKQTVEFYQKTLGAELILAISEDRVPSTKEPDPYIHVFLDAGQGNVLAFFEITNAPPMGRDPNTPAWVQHLAFKVKDVETLLAAKERLEGLGIDVLGPTNHELFQSIYFFDPNGHRIELAADTADETMLARLREVAHAMVDEWSQTKKVVRHASWLHAKEMASVDG